MVNQSVDTSTAESLDIESATSDKLNGVALAISKRGFGLPVLFLLEMYRPLAGVTGLATEGFQPVLEVVLGKANANELVRLLQNSEVYDHFLNLIETNLNSKGGA